VPLEPHSTTLARDDVAHRLRCHFITKTKLSKNFFHGSRKAFATLFDFQNQSQHSPVPAQPTHFLNWRNTQSSIRSEGCQQLTRLAEDFFGTFFGFSSASCLGLRFPDASIVADFQTALPKTCLDYIGRGTLGNPLQKNTFPHFRYFAATLYYESICEISKYRKKCMISNLQGLD
jgi:hypothetical protein